MFRHKLLLGSVTLAASLCAFPAMGITLEEATYTAIENNPTVRQALARYRESVESMEVSEREGFLPSVDLTAGFGHESTYDYQASGEDISLTRRELALTLTQPIFNGYGATNNVKRLNAEAEANRWNALIQVETKALEVSEAYTNVLRNRELVQLAESNLETHNRIYEQIQTATNSGVGRQSDFSQISARLAKAEANRLSALDNLRAAEANYKNVVGEMPAAELIYPEPDRSMVPTSLDEAISQALKTNPAIDSARWDVEATEHAMEAVKATNYPELNFVVERTFNNNIDGRAGANEDLTAMLRMSYNLYNGGADNHRQEVASQQNIQASEIQRNTIREAELTTRLAWAAYEAAMGSKSHLQQYVTATKESQLSYAQQFNLGRRTLLDVLDSENELFEARQDYVNADFDELYSVFRLFNSKGDLMRALRIYHPEELGFEQNLIPKERTADKIKAPTTSQTIITPVEPVAAVTTPAQAPYTPVSTAPTTVYQAPVKASAVTNTSSVATPTTITNQSYQIPAQATASSTLPVAPATSTVSSYQAPVQTNATTSYANNFPQGNTTVNSDGVIFIDATTGSTGW